MSTYADLHENPAGLNRLRIALLALLPKDGTPKAVADLAAAVCVRQTDVIDALFDDYMNHAIDFDLMTDTFSHHQPANLGAHLQ